MSTDWNGFKLKKGEEEKTAKQLHILMREGPSDPILPSTRDRTVTIPGRTGVYYFGADISERRINIPCAFVYAATDEDLYTHIEELKTHLLDANDRPAKLELTFEANQTIVYEVYYSGRLDLARRVLDGEFDLPFIAPNPLPDPISE